jgi:Ricin-type beta-trefoil lectin domain-like/Thiol-activated cytolysin
MNTSKKIILITAFACGLFTASHAQVQKAMMATRPGASTAAVTIQGLSNGIYFIKVNATGKYLGVEGVSKDNGARLVEWDFANQDNHKFYIEKRADGYYTIKALHSNRYLNIAGQSVDDGAAVLQWDFVEQDNLMWTLLKSTSLNGWIIRNKQSGKDIKLAGGINNNANGTLVVLNGNNQAGAQAYSFEPAAGTKTLMGGAGAVQKESKIQMVANSIEFNVPGGGKIYRYINPKQLINPAAKDRRTAPQFVKSEGRCNYYTAKVSTVEKSEMMTISNGNLVENFAPGLIYDVKELFNGDILNKEKFPYAQNRNPIQLTTTVKNFRATNNSIVENIERPDKITINQAIANFYARHTTREDRTSMQNARYYSCAVTSKSEFGLKVGAGGHYAFFSAQGGFEMSNSEEYKSLYFEATKELFTISARPATAEGFFATDPGNTSNLGFISSVTYGVRIIGKVDVENKADAMRGDLKASFEMGIAGAEVSMNTYKTNSSAKTIVTLYAVGGRCDKIGVCTIDNIESTIDEYLRTANYQVAQPIKLQFSTLDGQLMKFMDATDNFTYKECTPAALLNVPEDIVLDKLTITAENPNNSDYDFYGKIWVMAYDKNGVELPAVRGANMLMDVRGEQEIDLDNPSFANYSPGTSVTIHIPEGRSDGAYLKIYYALFDEDANPDYGTGDDDQFAFRNTDADHGCELGPTSKRWCVRTVYLNQQLNGGYLQDQLWDAEDGIGVRTGFSMTRLKK